MQDNATTYLENSSMTVLEEENIQLLYAGQCHDLPRNLLNDRPRRRKMYSCLMQNNATTYPEKPVNDRPRRRKCTVALCREMPRPT